MGPDSPPDLIVRLLDRNRIARRVRIDALRLGRLGSFDVVATERSAGR